MGFLLPIFFGPQYFSPISPYQIYKEKHVSSRRSISMFMSNNENQKFTALFSLLQQLRLQDRKKKVVLKSLASFRPKRDIHHKLKPGFMVSLLPPRVSNGEVCEWYVLFLKPNLMSTCKWVRECTIVKHGRGNVSSNVYPSFCHSLVLQTRTCPRPFARLMRKINSCNAFLKRLSHHWAIWAKMVSAPTPCVWENWALSHRTWNNIQTRQKITLRSASFSTRIVLFWW